MKRQSQRLIAMICLLAIISGSSYSFAQSGNITGKSPVPIDVSLLSAGTFKYFDAKYFAKVVKGAPYSAAVVTEHIQTLGDGNQIIRKKEAMVYRDGEGRTRLDQKLDTIGKWTAAGDARQMVYINDPVAGFSYNLDPGTKTVRKTSTFKYETLNQKNQDEERRMREQTERLREHESRMKEQARERETQARERARETEERARERVRESEERKRESDRRAKEREVESRQRLRETEARVREHETRVKEQESRIRERTRENELRIKERTRENESRIKERNRANEERIKRSNKENELRVKENERRLQERIKENEMRIKQHNKENEMRLKQHNRENELRIKERNKEEEQRIREHKERMKSIEKQNQEQAQVQVQKSLTSSDSQVKSTGIGVKKELTNSDSRKKIESLGKQTIEGVEVEGTRATRAIAAGEIGNTLPIDVVDESWYSPDLQVLVMTRHNDPRSGVITYRLNNIRRSEPQRSLFEIPADYTSMQEKGVVKVETLYRPGKPAEPAKKPVAVKKIDPATSGEPAKKITPIKKAEPPKKMESPVVKNELYQ